MSKNLSKQTLSIVELLLFYSYFSFKIQFQSSLSHFQFIKLFSYFYKSWQLDNSAFDTSMSSKQNHLISNSPYLDI